MEVRRATVRSLAKINLDLRVLHKHPDGYHELRTVFQSISLADTIGIEFQQARRRSITLDDPAGIPDNLIMRAAHAVLDEMKVTAKVHFTLEKQIPMGGGLGGGSSNAAAILLALPVLAGRRIPMDRLTWIGYGLGSDVPYFLHGGTQLALGRGAELYPLPDIRNQPLLLVSPGVPVATGPAYAALGRRLTFTGSSSSINSFQAYVRALDRERSAKAASELSANDFESVVFKQFPQLNKIAARLRKPAGLRKLDAGVRMSGSGSTIFALFGTKQERERALESLRGDRVMEGCRLMEASLVSRRAYHRLWRRQLAEHLKDDSWPLQSRHDR